MYSTLSFDIGSDARSRDGMSGEIVQVVSDPTHGRISHVVVKSGELKRRVPIALFEGSGAAVFMGCTKAEFDQLA